MSRSIYFNLCIPGYLSSKAIRNIIKIFSRKSQIVLCL